MAKQDDPPKDPSKTKNPVKLVIQILLILAVGLGVGWTVNKMRKPQSSSVPVVTKKRGKPKNFAYTSTDIPSLKVEDLPERRFKAIDIHEHVLDEDQAKLLLRGMDKYGIERSCLMASSWYTFTLDNQFGFERYKENNEELIRIRNKYPDRFCAFITLHPPEEGNLELVKDYAKRGADGIKLYLGHGAAHGKGPFHMMPLDDPRMLPIYEWAEKTQFPILMHVNLIKYFDEFVSIMEKYPYLRIVVPHFGLHKNTAVRLRRFEWLMQRYPNLYTDISFGWHTFHMEGLEAFGKWRTRSKAYFKKHSNKIMYGSDMVLEPMKDWDYVDTTLRSYMQFLEMEHYRFFMEPEFPMHGLALDDESLRKIYEDTPKTYLLLDDNGKLLDRTGEWPPAHWNGQTPGMPPLVPAVTPLAPGSKPWKNLPKSDWETVRVPAK